MAHVFKGLARRRVRDHGIKVIRRAEPFTVDQLCRMKRLQNGMNVGRRIYQSTDIFWAGWRLVDTYTDQTGARKAEIIGFQDIHFLHSDTALVVDGTRYPDFAEAALAKLRSGAYTTAYVTVKVNISKADPEGAKFGPNLVTSLYNPLNPMSFAVALVDYYTLWPLRGAARAATPLFTTDGRTRWTEKQIDTTLADVMAATLTPAERVRKTVHSKRVFCATGLRDLRSEDGEIQAMVRWSSLESLRVYARMGLEYQARRRDMLLKARVDAMNAATLEDLPQIDPVPEDAVYEDDLDALADGFGSPA